MTENPLKNKPETVHSLEIKRATGEDLPAVWGIIDTSAKWLSEKKLNHWARYYTEHMVLKMIWKKEVYVGLKDGKPVGTITADTVPPKYYEEEGYNNRFTNPDEFSYYVTAVAVLPEEQNQGFAGQMLQFVEDEARENEAKWLRLDCRAEVPGLVSFYEKRGFVKLGDEPVDEGEDGTYWLMEKSLLENN